MLRLSEAAALLGVAPATLRSYCDRGLVAFQQMPNGERRFRRADVVAFKRGEARRQEHARTVPASDADALIESRGRRNWEDTVPPWERRAHAAKAEIEVERSRQAVNRLRAEEAAQAAQAESAAELARAQQLEATRLLGLKQHGRSLCLFGSSSVERLVVRDLERWVTSANVPAFLTVWDQRRLVSDYAHSRAAGYENERRKVEVEALEEQRKRDSARFAEALRGMTAPATKGTPTAAPAPAPPVKTRPTAEEVAKAAEDRILEAREERYATMRNLRALARLMR